MSLDELTRSGVSSEMLVEIEGCKANPLTLLCKIAAAMECPWRIFGQRRQRADGPSIDRCYSGVVARRERRQRKTNGGEPAGRICWNLAMDTHPVNSFESAGHPADTVNYRSVNQEH